MTISLGGVVLDDSIIWQERYASQSVEQAVRRTLGGSAVVFTGALGAGVPITLLATTNFGWITKAQADAVMAMAATPGNVLALIYGAQSFSVVFRHNEPPAVDVQPLLARQTHLDTDHFIGAIKLLTV
jgi:hypothetical protein